MSTNMETKKTRVAQSIFFTTSVRLLLSSMGAVSYTHLTLPTNREV
ncbi:hypothetical protein [Methanosarcina mazei]|nr:hypothetical protein [Methanosarcina mazei]